MSKGVTSHDEGRVRWIVFDRPAKLNTLLFDDLLEARALVEGAAPAMRAVVFTGEGDRAFSAGVNMQTFMGLVSQPDEARSQIGAVKDLLDAVRQASVPTIAAINGHCLGGAFELALACDFRLATPNALLGLPEIKLGLPCILESALLQQFVGLAMAKEMMLTGRLYPAQEMADRGLVQLADNPDAMAEQVASLLQDLNHSAIGLASQKRLFEVWQNHSLRESNDISIDEIEHVFSHKETRDRVREYDVKLRG